MSGFAKKSGFLKKWVAGAVAAATLMAPQAEAAFFSYPKALQQQYERMVFETPAVAPYSYGFVSGRRTILRSGQRSFQPDLPSLVGPVSPL